MTVLSVRWNDCPAAYELGIGPGPEPTLVLRIRAEAFLAFAKQLPTCALIEKYRQRFGLPDFVFPFKDCLTWGFSPVATRISDQGPWNVWCFQLPSRLIPDLPTRTLPSQAAAATLEMAFTLLDGLFVPSDGRKQLVVIRSLDITGPGLAAECSPALRHWCRYAFQEMHREKIEETMRKAWDWMRNGEEQSDWEVTLEDDRVRFRSPGNRSELDPDSGTRIAPDLGYQWLPHQIDTFAKLFTLLSGLGQLSDLARKETA